MHFYLKCQSFNGILYFNIHIQENKSHGFFSSLQTNGKKPNLIFPKQFKHKYKLFKSCFH